LPTIVLYLASFAIGAGSAVQSSINAALARLTGVIEATFVSVTVTWLLVIALLALGFGNGDLMRVVSSPWYLLLGGVFGAMFLVVAIKAVPSIGVGAFLVTVIVGQLAGSMVLDQLGAFGNPQRSIDASRIAGIVLMLVGIKLVIR
jgi:transporter family-2 protein